MRHRRIAADPGLAASNQANGETLSPPPPDLAAIVPETKLEVFLLALLIDEPDLLIWLAEKSQELEIAPLSGKDFQQIEYREIFGALRRFIASDELWDTRAFQETLSPSYHPVLSQLTTQVIAMPEREQGDIQNAFAQIADYVFGMHGCEKVCRQCSFCCTMPRKTRTVKRFWSFHRS